MMGDFQIIITHPLVCPNFFFQFYDFSAPGPPSQSYVVLSNSIDELLGGKPIFLAFYFTM